MQNLDFKILREEDRLDDLSLEEIKGGMTSTPAECCDTNTACNINQPVPTQPLCPWCPVK